MTTQTREQATSAARAGSEQVRSHLEAATATAIDLHSQIKQAHWTVAGEEFISIHELFDEQADAMRGHIDTMAERLRMIGGIPRGTIQEAANVSTLPPLDIDVLNVQRAATEIADRYRRFADQVRESAQVAGDAGDLATQDVFIEVLRDLDKQEWFLRSHLNR